ncbi:hypothetical protein HNY73_011107 [Argiope bruennichi]|uniref:Uncharacterized protein n=1 Tax=Argiope bruennichi TaxID=94029 RepID=A0A8T0F829_ARGBR|nr:hypothetical protein HNY73_011107 [Argiope bruennichi]
MYRKPQTQRLSKPKDSPPKCDGNHHFEGNHTASNSGCSQNPMNKKAFPSAPDNPWTDPATLGKNKLHIFLLEKNYLEVQSSSTIPSTSCSTYS